MGVGVALVAKLMRALNASNFKEAVFAVRAGALRLLLEVIEVRLQMGEKRALGLVALLLARSAITTILLPRLIFIRLSMMIGKNSLKKRRLKS